MNTLDLLQAQLERARRELLDLSTRNRLLSTPRHRKRSRTIEVVDELSDELFRIVVRDGKAMGFRPVRETEHAEDEETSAEDAPFRDLAPPEEDEVDERGVAARHSDKWLQTKLTPEGLQKRLLGLYYDARTALEEQGVNILYLALGFLEWYEDASSDQARYAPLLLIPVDLERGSALERFRLSWSEEEISSNLSLLERLRTDFGIELSEVPGIEDLTPSEYFKNIENLVTSQRRFAVHPNDAVLGFFSFAKFLMYRDLDAEAWPEGSKLSDHTLVRGLLTDGFREEPSIIDDDEPIDPHIGPLDMVHVLDADSSQSVAIEQVRRGTNLVIQGPPGTGKSQSIANMIATAVASGKKVMFVAEKMAALDVVKRRLDAIGLGDMCLELHSQKANKRVVLDELQRTLDLGSPNKGDLDSIAVRVEGARNRLNDHVTRLHAPIEPSGQTTYCVIGHLVRLNQKGVGPADFALPETGNWTWQEFIERRALISELARRIEEIGKPRAHPWRGVGIEAVLPADVSRFVNRLADLTPRLEALISASEQLCEMLGCNAFGNAAKGIALLVNTGLRVAAAPESLDVKALCSPAWTERRNSITDLIAAGQELELSRSKLNEVVVDAAWSTDMAVSRRNLAAYGESWFRFLNGAYRRASAMLRGILAVPPPKSLREKLQILDTLIAGREAKRLIADDDALGAEAFGKLWRREKSDWNELAEIEEWDRASRDEPVPDDFRTIIARVVDREKVGKLATDIGGRLEPLANECRALFAEVKLDIQEAFGVDSVDAIPLDQVIARFNVWTTRSTDITQWIAYCIRAEQAISHGLAPIVERLYDGRLSPQDAIDAFEMVYYEALIRKAFQQNPELASFDGQEHESLVKEFCDLDRRRIELARSEVALAHYQGMPRSSGEVGQLAILHREFAKKRRHLPIRQLMKHAGLAIQAIKPVFMMSPLSIARFLEPGALGFDLLLIDEASQVRPVDALGAVARAKQMAVVGDDKQLPPTRFFTRTLAEEDEDEDPELVTTADIESILGLSTAQGIPQSMLRWHYRSRHPSLISVSNHEFYDDRLFVAPSAYAEDAKLGLKFHYLSDGVFDSGGTATNRIEAGAVARAVIEHAREHPGFSLGVGCFSIRQRDAILDALEHLWRSERDVKDFFDTGVPEPFFVKNLENIQGDERDVIFVSIGYARNKSGYLAMRFGPVSAVGGERRLNVLISRARHRCEVFSSITADDIDLERGRGHGVAVLKTFLQYAQTGTLGIATSTEGEYDSPFEEEVAKALSSLGHQVESQIGVAGFFVDLAIIDPDRPGRYLLGIECDGAAYHSSRSARDRDRLRQEVLEDHGWIIHRIWSTDWFQRPDGQLRKTVAAIEAAKAVWARRDQSLADSTPAKASNAPTNPVEREPTLIGHTPQKGLTAEPYHEADFTVPTDQEPHEMGPGQMADIVVKIVTIEGPIHGDEIARRITSLWGLQRTGNRIVAAARKGISNAIRHRGITREGEFYSLVDGKETNVRDRSNVSSPTLKKSNMLPPTEIRAALFAVVKAHLGVSRDDAITQASRLLGFKATSEQLHEIIDTEVSGLVDQGTLKETAQGLQET